MNCFRCNSDPCGCADGITLYHADCREVLPTLEAGSVDCVVTDPPYGLGFMGKDWDRGVPGVHFWELVAGVCLPGSPLLAFGGTRTYHRLVCAIEDAGWQIRDCLQWIYGSGFPKSLDVSKAIDKAAGEERESVGTRPLTGTARIIGGQGGATSGRADEMYTSHEMRETLNLTAPATPAARLWDGWGTALKPAYEPIVLAMKPLDGTFANNALTHGVAGLNVDGCRVEHDEECKPRKECKPMKAQSGGNKVYGQSGRYEETTDLKASGRWPANIVLDGSDEVVEGFPVTDGRVGMTGNTGHGNKIYGNFSHQDKRNPGVIDSGSAARFFYCAKASDRDILPAESFPLWGEEHDAERNTHPTVKPLALMEWLIKLVTMPEPKTLLDPFAGSGTTGRAAKDLGRKCIMVEIEERYCEIAAERLRQEVLALPE